MLVVKRKNYNYRESPHTLLPYDNNSIGPVSLENPGHVDTSSIPKFAPKLYFF